MTGLNLNFFNGVPQNYVFFLQLGISSYFSRHTIIKMQNKAGYACKHSARHQASNAREKNQQGNKTAGNFTRKCYIPYLLYLTSSHQNEKPGASCINLAIMLKG